jgi:hypothetical protein
MLGRDTHHVSRVGRRPPTTRAGKELVDLGPSARSRFAPGTAPRGSMPSPSMTLRRIRVRRSRGSASSRHDELLARSCFGPPAPSDDLVLARVRERLGLGNETLLAAAAGEHPSHAWTIDPRCGPSSRRRDSETGPKGKIPDKTANALPHRRDGRGRRRSSRPVEPQFGVGAATSGGFGWGMVSSAASRTWSIFEANTNSSSSMTSFGTSSRSARLRSGTRTRLMPAR